jgi:hypothetical protein
LEDQELVGAPVIVWDLLGPERAMRKSLTRAAAEAKVVDFAKPGSEDRSLLPVPCPAQTTDHDE